MPKLKEGSQAWLDQLYDVAAQEVRAFNQIEQAARHISKLFDEWDALDGDLKSALFTSVVIHYARPFTNNRNLRGRRSYPVSQFKGAPEFDRQLHRHLCSLRDKLVAHQDGTFLRAQIGQYIITLTFPDDDAKIPVSFFAATTAFHGLANREICDRYRKHIHAACMAVHTLLDGTLRAIAIAAHKYRELRFGSKELPAFEGKGLPSEIPPSGFERFIADIEIPDSPVPPTAYVWRQSAVASTPLAKYTVQSKDGPVSFEVVPLKKPG